MQFRMLGLTEFIAFKTNVNEALSHINEVLQAGGGDLASFAGPSKDGFGMIMIDQETIKSKKMFKTIEKIKQSLSARRVNHFPKFIGLMTNRLNTKT